MRGSGYVRTGHMGTSLVGRGHTDFGILGATQTNPSPFVRDRLCVPSELIKDNRSSRLIGITSLLAFQLTSSKPYIRKRACLLLYKVFLRYPDALRPTFARLKEKLEDPDSGTYSTCTSYQKRGIVLKCVHRAFYKIF